MITNEKIKVLVEMGIYKEDELSSIVFLYVKEGKIKTFSSNLTKEKHEEMLKNGWKHTSMVNACRFFEEIFNNTPIEEYESCINAFFSTNINIAKKEINNGKN